MIAIAVVAGMLGCRTATQNMNAGRPERFTQQAPSNLFLGDWGPEPGYVANDWLVRFTSDGRMSVEGPGLTARGYYVPNGRIARVNYFARDGEAPQVSKLSQGVYTLTTNGNELTFTTGIAEDPPIHLRRVR